MSSDPHGQPRPPLIPVIVIGVVLALLLTIAGTAAVVRTIQVGQLRDEVAAAQDDITRLEARLDDSGDGNASGGATDPDAVPEEAPDSGADDPLGGLLDGLLGGEGGDGLSGPVDSATIECLTPEDGGAPGGGLEGLLDGLLGEEDDQAAPQDPQEVVAEIADEVAAIRGLEFLTPVDAVFLDDDAIEARVGELFDEDYAPEDADIDARLLTALGVLDPGIDLGGLLRDMLASQVAGFYVPDTGELVVRSPGGADIAVTDRISLAHELDHALTDQHLDLPIDEDGPGGEDGAQAALAVIEGDATLLMNQWSLANLSFADQLGMLGNLGELQAAQQGLDAVPHYLGRQLLFPYTEGLSFACSAWKDTGWEAVDGLYQQPPTTTAQVLFPDRYAAGEGAAEVAAPTAPAGWEQREDDTFGAASLQWLFEAPGDDEGAALDDPRGRAAAWGGGRSVVWARGEDTAVGIGLVERPGSAAPPLCESVTAWYDAVVPDDTRAATGDTVRFAGEPQNAVIRCTGDQVRIGLAPDLQTAEAIAG